MEAGNLSTGARLTAAFAGLLTLMLALAATAVDALSVSNQMEQLKATAHETDERQLWGTAGMVGGPEHGGHHGRDQVADRGRRRTRRDGIGSRTGRIRDDDKGRFQCTNVQLHPLSHSTVTLFARFRGLSTSVPRATAV